MRQRQYCPCCGSKRSHWLVDKVRAWRGGRRKKKAQRQDWLVISQSNDDPQIFFDVVPHELADSEEKAQEMVAKVRLYAEPIEVHVLPEFVASVQKWGQASKSSVMDDWRSLLAQEERCPVCLEHVDECDKHILKGQGGRARVEQVGV